jgi:hypothetical protein
MQNIRKLLGPNDALGLREMGRSDDILIPYAFLLVSAMCSYF